MWRYFTENNTLTYIDILPALVDAYNHSHHRSIGMTPAQVTPEKEEEVWQRLYGEKQHKTANKKSRKKNKTKRRTLQVGDWVRLSKSKRAFKKGYLPGWTEVLFSIVRCIAGEPPLYIVQDYNGEILEGGFYAEELQKVNKVDNLYRVEAVVDERTTKGGVKQVKVKWLGYPNKFNSWIVKKDLLDYDKRRTSQ